MDHKRIRNSRAQLKGDWAGMAEIWRDHPEDKAWPPLDEKN